MKPTNTSITLAPMTTLKISDGLIKDDVLVVGLVSTNTKGGLAIESGEYGLNTENIVVALSEMGATGKVDEVTKFPGGPTRMLVFTGLGKQSSEYGHETLRRAAGAAARTLTGTSSATFALPSSDLDSLSAIAEGVALGAYVFTEFKGTSKSENKNALKSATIFSSLGSKGEAKDIVTRAKIIAQYTHLVRDLINTPPSHLTPDSFTRKLVAEIRSAGGVKVGLRSTVWDDKQLKSQGFGGIVGVGQGSANPPRLLHISYTPKVKAHKRYALVGKGITFDTGGLNLKPGIGMERMKSDMSGAAAICAATIAIAQLGLPIAIEAWAPLAENMPSDTATRPSDVITIYGGKTVEVLNPDAEGRLILADALVKAQASKNNLDGIIDVATLTGAQVVALGTRTGAVMTNNQEFSEKFLAAAQLAGEQFWPMPLPVELRASLDSPVADLANIGEKNGGMLVAGLFLKEFVSDALPWLHIDIAGPAYNEGKAHGYTPVGGVGIALRSIVRLVEAG